MSAMSDPASPLDSDDFSRIPLIFPISCQESGSVVQLMDSTRHRRPSKARCRRFRVSHFVGFWPGCSDPDRFLDHPWIERLLVSHRTGDGRIPHSFAK